MTRCDRCPELVPDWCASETRAAFGAPLCLRHMPEPPAESPAAGQRLDLEVFAAVVRGGRREVSR